MGRSGCTRSSGTLPRRRGLEASGADAGGRCFHGGDAPPRTSSFGRLMTAGHVRLDEAQFHTLREAARHLAPGERIHLELEILGDPPVGVLLASDLTGLVVHDDRAQQVLVDPVEASTHAIVADAEREVLLDLGGLQPFGLLLMPEAGEGITAGRLASFLVLPGEEALVQPLAIVLGQEVVERRVVPLRPGV